MSTSELQELPEQLREILLEYREPLYKTISVLLRGRDEDFQLNFKDVTIEVLKYCDSLELVLSEEYFNLLLNYSAFSSIQADLEQTQTPVTQPLANAIGIIANFIRLMLEPDYRDHVRNHPGILEPYIELLTYTAILLYINDKPETKIKRTMLKKIIMKCQNATEKVEEYVDTIEIDADPEASAALEHAKQMSF